MVKLGKLPEKRLPEKLWVVGLLLGGILLPATAGFAGVTPQSTVEGFYQWFVSNPDQARQQIAQQQDSFDPELYQQLVQAFDKQPEDGAWLNFDPFSDTQVTVFGYKIRSVTLPKDQTATVAIEVYAGLRPPGDPVPIQVVLQQQNGQWQIKNLIYRKGADNLWQILRDINRPAR